MTFSGSNDGQATLSFYRPVDRVDGLSVSDFHGIYTRQERPVVLRGAAREWPAFKKWTPDYLKSLIGSREVRVTRSPDGDFFDPDRKEDYTRNCTMPFDKFIDAAFDDSSKEKLYLLHTFLPELTREVVVPDYVRPPLRSSNFWIGARGNITRCHYDMQDNLLAHLRGHKRVVLFPATQFAQMYPRFPLGSKPNFSRVNIENPDYSRFPNFRHVTGYETMLEPGDVLYIPVHWFHQVHSLEAGISINFWWQVRVRQALRRPGLRYFPFAAREGYLHKELFQLAERAVSVVRAQLSH